MPKSVKLLGILSAILILASVVCLREAAAWNDSNNNTAVMPVTAGGGNIGAVGVGKDDIASSPESAFSLATITAFEYFVNSQPVGSDFAIRRIGAPENNLYILEFKDYETCGPLIELIRASNDDIGGTFDTISSFANWCGLENKKDEDLSDIQKEIKGYLFDLGLMKKVVSQMDANIFWDEGVNPDTRLICVFPKPLQGASDFRSIYSSIVNRIWPSPGRRDNLLHELSHYFYEFDASYREKAEQYYNTLPVDVKEKWESMGRGIYPDITRERCINERMAIEVDDVGGNPLRDILTERIKDLLPDTKEVKAIER
jgi:hypothetical protein